jgi:predicted nucleic acid-binding Zn ribbon protein
MPLYAFECPGCGPFELRTEVGAQCRQVIAGSAGGPIAGRCPDCGGEARRVFTAPGLARLSLPMRRARDMEERSAHEPEVVTSKRGRPLHVGHGSCC